MQHKILNIIGIIAVVIAIVIAYHITTPKENIMNTGIKTENMDLSVRPGDDFYDYATGGWQKNNPIPSDYTRYGAFETLNDINMQRVREIAETDTGKIGTLYKIAMDADKLNQDGITPVKKYLDEIDKIKSITDLPSYLGRVHKFTSAFWADGVALDEKNSEYYLYNIGQGGIGMARDYYFDDDEKSVEIRAKYREFIARQLKNFGIDANADKIYELEQRMAHAFYPKEKLRDPAANYHKMTIDQVREQFPDFDWDAYLTARGATAATEININQPAAISESIAIMNDTDIDLVRDYLKYRIISAADTLLDDQTYEISFDFYNRTMAGQPEPKPRWKRAVALLDGSLGEEIGRLYVEKYFPSGAKERMQNLVHNLQRALGMRIEQLSWMSDETKSQAMKKLNTFHAKIGYPDKWRDYSALNISQDASLWENIVRVSEFEDEFWIKKLVRKKTRLYGT